MKTIFLVGIIPATALCLWAIPRMAEQARSFAAEKTIMEMDSIPRHDDGPTLRALDYLNGKVRYFDESDLDQIPPDLRRAILEK